jgi:transcriptional regulator with PAS, ATPase and Fis domain
MDKPPFPIRFAGRPSDALAIFEEGLIVYANNSFEKLYNSLKNADRKRFGLELRDLNLDLQQSGKAFAQKHLTLIPHDMEIDIHVYLLNKSGSEKNCLLVLVNPGNPHAESLAFITEHEQVRDSNQILKKGTQMKLSAAFSELVGEDPHFKAVLFKAQKAAKSDYPVLIEGESGTGKEILARTIHQTSRRGYEKGAFTGATPGGRHGLFVEAHQGTLFFDEVSDASLQTQAKLLRVLNEGYFKRIGSTKNIEVDVRIISATNKDLSLLIKERRFREDLIYRLNTISIYLPPLRDRPEDILLLANFFLKKHSKKQHRNLQFSANCLDFLKLYHWPGNVRELKGVVDYMATMASGSLITENYFPDFLVPAEHRSRDRSEGHYHHLKGDRDSVLLSTAVEHTEKEVIREVLQKARTRSEAIKILGISRRTFYTKLKQYNLS